MKLLLISDSSLSSEEVKPFFAEYGFDLIHYHSPLKAMDNLEEIQPDAVVINTVDFPRHWKTITQYIRWDNTKDKVFIVLLTGEEFQPTEADKAITLGIQGMVKLKNDVKSIFESLKIIFDRYKYGRTSDIPNNVQFLFTNPIDETIITGTVKDLTLNSLLFAPDMPANTSNLEKDMILEHCSLKIGQNLLVPNCKIICEGNVLELLFLDLSDDDKKRIKAFLY